MLVTSGVSDLSGFRHLYPACFLSLSPVVKMWAILMRFHSFLLVANWRFFPSVPSIVSITLSGRWHNCDSGRGGWPRPWGGTVAGPGCSCPTKQLCSLGGGTRWIPCVLSDLWEEVSHPMNPRNWLHHQGAASTPAMAPTILITAAATAKAKALLPSCFLSLSVSISVSVFGVCVCTHVHAYPIAFN